MPYLLFGSAVGVLFLACALLLTRNKQPVHRLMITYSLVVAFVALCLWAETTGLVLRFPVLAGADIAVAFLAGPALYLAALSVLHEGQRPVRSYVACFLLPVTLSLGTLLLNALTAPTYVREFGSVPGHFSNPFVMILGLGAALLFAAAIVFALFAARGLQKSGGVQDPRALRAQVLFLLLYLSAALVLLSSFIFRSEWLYKASFLLICLIVIFFGLTRIAVSFSPRKSVSQRFRDAFKKPAWEHEAQEFSARLEALMKSSAPYRVERLTLRRLAHMLGVTPQRLAYHIHTRHALNFQGYINEWRLRAVCRDLIEKPEQSILDVALGSGFNSKSSFNTLFLNKYGRTPKEYRKEHLAP